MHPQYLDLLCCPATHEPLALRADETNAQGLVLRGELVSPSGRRYPILRGIPRFVGAEYYAASFGYEWTRWPRLQFEAENVGKPMAGHTRRMWEVTTGINDQRLDGQLVVDFGCGPGRFLDIVRRKGGRAIGLDISLAVESARLNFAADPDVLIVQGDILHPPFREGAFDGGYSIGVLHHTPDPQQGVNALARTVKPGGWVAVCVYPKDEFYDYASVARFRRWHARLKPTLGYRPALAYAYVAAYVLAPLWRLAHRLPGLAALASYLERNWLVVLYLPDVQWTILDIFDAITPAIASTHQGDEVRQWMSAAQCERLSSTAWCATSLVGIRM